MADIDIEKKNSVWPWIIGGVIIAAILLLIFIGDSPEEAVAEDEPVELAEEPPELADDEGTAAITGDALEAEEPIAGETNLIDEDFNLTPVIDYVTFVNENEDRLGYDHNYTHDALVKLTDAVQALADEIGADLQADLNRVTEIARAITTDPLSEQHANKIIDALRILTNALTELQEAYYPGLSEEVSAMEEDMSQLEKIATSLNPDELTTEQKEIINSYFNQAAQVLKLMN